MILLSGSPPGRAKELAMAKRRTARNVDLDDDGGDDDGYAWDSPPKKKKKKKKKSTGSMSGSSRKKSSAGASARKSARAKKSGSARSKASGSARSRSSSGRRSGRSASGEMNTSGRRRRGAPPAKKSDDKTVMLVSIVSITLILCVGIALFNKASAPGPQVNHQSELDAARSLLDQGKAKFREYNAAKSAGQPSQQLFQQALTSLQNGVDQMSQVLQQPQYVDAEGFTKPEYEGYETEMSEAAQLIIDLEKSGSLH
jgi:hypothetical protein